MGALCVGRCVFSTQKGGASKQERSGRGCAPREQGSGARHQGHHNSRTRADMQAWRRTGGWQRRFALLGLAHDEKRQPPSSG